MFAWLVCMHCTLWISTRQHYYNLMWHTAHIRTGCVLRGTGLSRGRKSVHRTLFTPVCGLMPPFQVRATIKKRFDAKASKRFLLLVYTLDIVFHPLKTVNEPSKKRIFRSQVSIYLSAVEAIHNHADHHFFFFRFGFCNHDRQRHQSMIVD